MSRGRIPAFWRSAPRSRPRRRGSSSKRSLAEPARSASSAPAPGARTIARACFAERCSRCWDSLSSWRTSPAPAETSDGVRGEAAPDGYTILLSPTRT